MVYIYIAYSDRMDAVQRADTVEQAQHLIDAGIMPPLRPGYHYIIK